MFKKAVALLLLGCLLGCLCACSPKETSSAGTVTSLPPVSSAASASSAKAVSSQMPSTPEYTTSYLPGGEEIRIYPDGRQEFVQPTPDMPAYWNPGKRNFTKSYYENTEMPDLSALRDEVICQVSTVSDRTYLLTESGRLFACGNSEYCAFGQASCFPIYGLYEIQLDEKVKLVCATWGGACAVGESNTIYYWGRFGSLYDKREPDDGFGGHIPDAIPFDKNICAISSGGSRILILTEDSEAYTVGDDFTEYFGQDTCNFNGIEWTEEKRLIPQKIETPEKIVQIIGATSVSFLLGESGTCYAAYNSHAVSLPSHVSPTNPNLRVIDFSQPIAKIGSAGVSLIALTEDGAVYTAGHSIDSTNKKESSKFEKVQLPEKAVDVGQAYEARFYFVGESGKVYAGGWNNIGLLLTGTGIDSTDLNESVSVLTPMPMLLPPVTVFNGSGTAYFFRDFEGRVYFAGVAAYGNGLSVPVPEDGDGYYVQRTPVEVLLNFSDDCVFR